MHPQYRGMVTSFLHIFTFMLYRQWMCTWVGYYSLFIRTWGWWSITVTRIEESEPNYPHPFTYHECGRFVVKDTTQLSLCCTSWLALSPYISAHASIRWSFIYLFSHGGTHPDLGGTRPVVLYIQHLHQTGFYFFPCICNPCPYVHIKTHRWVMHGS